MKLYWDTEVNEIITETQLRNEFTNLQRENPDDYGDLTFEQFEANCHIHSGGTLVDYNGKEI